MRVLFMNLFIRWIKFKLKMVKLTFLLFIFNPVVTQNYYFPNLYNPI